MKLCFNCCVLFSRRQKSFYCCDKITTTKKKKYKNPPKLVLSFRVLLFPAILKLTLKSFSIYRCHLKLIIDNLFNLRFFLTEKYHQASSLCAGLWSCHKQAWNMCVILSIARLKNVKVRVPRGCFSAQL